MKLALRLPFLLLLLCCLFGAPTDLQAQTPTPTPDLFVLQITSATPVPSPTPGGLAFPDSFVRDINGNGRFVVIESNGDIATLLPGQTAELKSPNNRDGNREIFLYDYAQRRIFQITNTRHALAVSANNPTVNSNIVVEVSNNRPMLSRDGRWIVFSSNAFNQNVATSSPFDFDGDAPPNEDALRLDGNQEIFLYRIPDVPAVDLTSGADVPFINLRQDVFTRVTNTSASRLPTPGSATQVPFVADDNREASINDRGTRIAFVSTRNLPITNAGAGARAGNADRNPEVFVFNATAGTVSQITFTSGLLAFNTNPSISGDTTSDTSAENPTSVIAFSSNATMMPDSGGANAAATNADANGEIFFANFNGVTDTVTTQVTRTRTTTAGFVLNAFSFGRRLSRDGNFIAFETVATDPGSNADTASGLDTVFVYNIAAQSFTAIGPRPTADDGSNDVVFRFPVFAGLGADTRVVFISSLNITASGTRVNFNDATGLNPSRRVQIFAAPVAGPSAAQPVVRVSNTPAAPPGRDTASPQPFVSDTVERLAFSIALIELGTGNADGTVEAYYQVLPPTQGANVTPGADVIQYFTGASQRPVLTPTASPSPTPTPSPTPAATPLPGLAPGMIAIVRTTSESGVTFSTTTFNGNCPAENPNCAAASETRRSPSLPVELGGVSLSIANAAAGLYFVGPNEIQFVVPPGLAATVNSGGQLLTAGTNSALALVIRVREGAGVVRTIRSQIQITPVQPDVFTVGVANRAAIFNVTLLGTMMEEPPEGFPVTTNDASGQPVPTVLALMTTGVRNATASQITITIGDRAFTGATQVLRIRPTDTPGIELIDFQLRADVAGIGDQPIIVSINSGGPGTFTSRPADTAPRVRIR